MSPQSPLTILVVHNHYRQLGGEDLIFATEAALLEQRGHKVIRYVRHNDQVGEFGSLRLATNALWNHQVYREVRNIVRGSRPDVVHVHNTLPLISPAVYHAAKAEGAAVVQTLHNYRLFCPNALFLRAGKVCDDCAGKLVPWPGILHACYRRSRWASAGVAAVIELHRTLRTWSRKIDIYLAGTEFSRQKFIECGLPAGQLLVKPNFVFPDPLPGDGSGSYAAFVGRLSPEKGIRTLLSAVKQVGRRVPTRIVGDGPLAGEVRTAAAGISDLTWLGQRSLREVYELMGKAAFLIVRSEWYEMFPRVVVESFAKGTPVIASKIGGLAELVDHGRTGLHFRCGDAEDLAAKMTWAVTHHGALERMRREARAEFDSRYSAKANYNMLVAVYRDAAARVAGC